MDDQKIPSISRSHTMDFKRTNNTVRALPPAAVPTKLVRNASSGNVGSRGLAELGPSNSLEVSANAWGKEAPGLKRSTSLGLDALGEKFESTMNLERYRDPEPIQPRPAAQSSVNAGSVNPSALNYNNQLPSAQDPMVFGVPPTPLHGAVGIGAPQFFPPSPFFGVPNDPFGRPLGARYDSMALNDTPYMSPLFTPQMGAFGMSPMAGRPGQFFPASPMMSFNALGTPHMTGIHGLLQTPGGAGPMMNPMGAGAPVFPQPQFPGTFKSQAKSSRKSPGLMVEMQDTSVMLRELRAKMKSNSGGFLPQTTGVGRGMNQGSQSFRETQKMYRDMGITWTLNDIKPDACEFSRDQFGSRFIQFKLEDTSVPQVDKEAFFKELEPFVQLLCKDVFGNYVIQKVLDTKVGTPEQHNFIYVNAVKGHMVELSTHMYGCRVIQKLVEQVFGKTSQIFEETGSISGLSNGLDNGDISGNVYDMNNQDLMLGELSKEILSLVTDQNGNHVVQKCIEKIRPISRLAFVFEQFKGQYVSMSKHPYGCRVVQRVLENTGLEIAYQVVSEIMSEAQHLVTDQYANYVIQHIIEHQKEQSYTNEAGFETPEAKKLLEGIKSARQSIFEIVAGRVVRYSTHKFGSNVVESCLNYGNVLERDIIIDTMLRGNNLISMMKDPYANYVVQKVIDKASQNQVQRVVQTVQHNLLALRRLTYGKHIINKLNSVNCYPE